MAAKMCAGIAEEKKKKKTLKTEINVRRLFNNIGLSDDKNEGEMMIIILYSLWV